MLGAWLGPALRAARRQLPARACWPSGCRALLPPSAPLPTPAPTPTSRPPPLSLLPTPSPITSTPTSTSTPQSASLLLPELRSPPPPPPPRHSAVLASGATSAAASEASPPSARPHLGQSNPGGNAAQQHPQLQLWLQLPLVRFLSSSAANAAATAGGSDGGGDVPRVGTQEAVAGERFSPDQPDSPTGTQAEGRSGRQRSALLEQLARAARQQPGPEGVLQVVERSGQDFDEQALVAALQAVADACEHGGGRGGGGGGGGGGVEEEEGDLRRWVARHNTFQSLLSMVVAGAERLTPAQATAVARSLGRLRVEDEGVLDAIGRNIVSELHRLDGTQIADLLEAYKLTGASPGRVLADAVQERLQGGSGGSAVPSSGDHVTANDPAPGRPEEGGGGGGGDISPAAVGSAESERVQRALEELGYGGAAGAPPPRQGQSDRSHGADYA